MFLSVDCKLIFSSKLLTQVTNLCFQVNRQNTVHKLPRGGTGTWIFLLSSIPLTRGMNGSENTSSRSLDEDIINWVTTKKAIKGNCWANAGQSLRIVWLDWVWEGQHVAEGPQEQRVSLQPTQSIWAHQQALNATAGMSPLKQEEKTCGWKVAAEHWRKKLLWGKGQAKPWEWNKLLKLQSGLGQCRAMKQGQYNLLITVNRGC